MALPIIRSGDLFTKYGPDVQSEYFNTIANSPSDQVLPEHVFGTNGWQRRLAASGADPAVAAQMFAERWDSIPAVQRRNMLEGNAVARKYASGTAKIVADGTFQAKLDAASAISKDPQLGLLAIGNPVGVTERLISDWLGSEGGV